MTLSAYEKERVLIFYCSGDVIMDETRLAQIGIIVTERKAVSELNGLLSVYGEYIIGRMGLPLKERGVSVISLVVDAPADVINTLTGGLGNLSGAAAKTLFAKADGNKPR